MNIKSQHLSLWLFCEAVITQNLPDAEQSGDAGRNIITPNDGIEVQADSNIRRRKAASNYSQTSGFSITIPKTIILGADKKASYPVKVEGDIADSKQICIVPVDEIAETDVCDFYMEDQATGSKKADVIAKVSQS